MKTIMFFKSAAIYHKLRTGLLITLLTICSFNSFSQQEKTGVNIGLVYPLSTLGVHAKEYSNYFSLNAISGISKSEKAFTVAGFSNIILEDARGFQVAGFSNHIGGSSYGFKAAGFMNVSHNTTGFLSAGFANFSRGNVQGMQSAGFMNMTRDLTGFQAAGFINITDDVKGMQAAGFMNLADSVKGSQYAGYINIAGDIEGVQVAGFMNKAKKVNGVQIAGFINIADSSDYPIGIINIIKNGEQSIGISTDDQLTTLVSFRSGGKKLYGIIGLGYNFENTREVYALQWGLGAHLIKKNNFRFNTEATVTSLENFKRGDFFKASISALPALRFGSKVEIFGGPAFNYVNTNSSEGKALSDHSLWRHTSNNGNFHNLYVGYTAGIQIIL